MNSPPRLALVTTVKNERLLLRLNLLYHHYLGIEKCYVFDDGSTDGTNDTICDLPFVQIAPSVAPELFAGQPEYAEFVARAAEYHTARQNLNSLTALQQARQEGFDWLISLDADELICVDLKLAYEKQLVDFFRQVPKEIETVRFPVLEIVQRDIDYTNVFAEGTLFKLIDRRSQIRHWIYNPFPMRQYVRQGFKGRLYVHTGFYGQDMGKSALRTYVPAKPKTTHKYVHLDGSPLNTGRGGYLLHYHCYNFLDFINKYRNFRNHPDTHISGQLTESIKRMWRDVVNNPDFSEEYLHRYYRRWIAFGGWSLKRLRSERKFWLSPRPSPLVEVTAIRQVFLGDLKQPELANLL